MAGVLRGIVGQRRPGGADGLPAGDRDECGVPAARGDPAVRAAPAVASGRSRTRDFAVTVRLKEMVHTSLGVSLAVFPPLLFVAMYCLFGNL